MVEMEAVPPRGDYPYSPLGATTGKLFDFQVYKLIF